jgi:hypothetical protein
MHGREFHPIEVRDGVRGASRIAERTVYVRRSTVPWTLEGVHPVVARESVTLFAQTLQGAEPSVKEEDCLAVAHDLGIQVDPVDAQVSHRAILPCIARGTQSAVFSRKAHTDLAIGESFGDERQNLA